MRTYKLISQTALDTVWHDLTYCQPPKKPTVTEFYTERKGITRFPNKKLAEDVILNELIAAHMRVCGKSQLLSKISTEVTIH